MKEHKKVKIVGKKRDEGEDDVMVDVVDMGETGARVTEDVGLVGAKVSSVEKVVVVKKGNVAKKKVASGSDSDGEKNGKGKPEKIGKETAVLKTVKVKKGEGRVACADEGLVGNDKAEGEYAGTTEDNATVVGGSVVEPSSGEAEIGNEDKELEKGLTEETVEGNTESVKEAAAVDVARNVKSEKDEVLDSAKVSESVGKVNELVVVSDVVNAGTGEGAAVNDNTENLDGKAEAEDGKTDNAKVGDDPMSEDTPIIEEVAVMVKKEKPEIGFTKEIAEQPVVDVQKVADEDHVMDEAQEDVDVVVVEEGLQVKDENKDGVSVELSLACSDGQNLSTEVVNADVNVTDPKAEAEVDVTDKNESLDATIEVNSVDVGAHNEPDKVVACSRADEAKAAQKEPNSDVHAATDSSKPDVVTYTEPEVVEIDTGVQTVKVEPVSPPTTGDTGDLQENQGLTDVSLTDIGVPDSTVEAPSTGEPQTYVEHSVSHAELEGEGMDIDEVLGWKDEIPGPDRSLQVGEQKVDITHPHDITHSLDNELFVSLQQLKYFSPRENKGDFAVSDLVWGKVRSHPWWPGQIFDLADASEQAVKHHKKDCFLVAYFGDKTFAWNESAVLKPFRSYFSQIDKNNSSETFNNAVDCALEEVSRRVKLGLTCSCVSRDIYEKIKCQSVENSGIKEESSRRQGFDKSASVNSFEPNKLVEYVRLLAKFPFSPTDKIDITIAKAQLLSYLRHKGYGQLTEFQMCGDLMEDDSVLIKDGPKKRKAVDSISDGPEKRPSLDTEAAQKPSFKIGSSSQKVATQLTAPGDQSNQAEMLSQLHSTARDPMKAHTSSNTIVPFFNNHRSAVVTKSRQDSSEARKRKPSNENEPEECEVDDVNDSYWTDRVIENYPEDQLVQENQNGSVEHQEQLIAYQQQQQKLQQQIQQVQQVQQVQQPVKTRRSNKKRYFSSNHEIEAKEQLELIERRRQNLATEVLMKYPEGIYFPSEIHLNKMFRRFGPLVESETEVDRQSGRARVVFKKCSDAEVAHSSAGKFNIFGSIAVAYELNYTPLISYKPIPLSFSQDQDAC
ncbi:putative PWWP domain-containing protein [Tanacetum coccineum]|uniref:PWWP domain-containing protein n=1 Tax=Tanacetum coccineum TaxID=301880 RepID=A0ABQ4XJ67_9ASTR